MRTFAIQALRERDLPIGSVSANILSIAFVAGHANGLRIRVVVQFGRV